MPLPIAAAGAAVARRAALSAARRSGRSKIVKSRRAKMTGGTSGGKGSKRDQISWFEILFVGGLAFLFNDLPDIANTFPPAQIVTGPIDILTMPALSAWFWLRVGEKPIRSGANNGMKFLVEILPFVGILPLWTLSILNVKLRWFDFFFNFPAKILKLIGL